MQREFDQCPFGIVAERMIKKKNRDKIVIATKCIENSMNAFLSETLIERVKVKVKVTVKLMLKKLRENIFMLCDRANEHKRDNDMPSKFIENLIPSGQPSDKKESHTRIFKSEVDQCVEMLYKQNQINNMENAKTEEQRAINRCLEFEKYRIVWKYVQGKDYE